MMDEADVGRENIHRFERGERGNASGIGTSYPEGRKLQAEAYNRRVYVAFDDMGA